MILKKNSRRTLHYLKRFNESQDDFKEELRDFCEIHLAYLLDNGFIVVINEFEDLEGYEITIKRDLATAPGGFIRQPLFTWDDVRDYIGPFILYLDREYKLFKSNEKSGKVDIGDIGIVQTELDLLFDHFNVDEIINANYAPFSNQLLATNTKLEYILIYSVFEK